MECPRCGARNPIEARLCSECATPLGGTMATPRPTLVLANRASRLAAKIIDLPFSAASVLLAMNLPSIPGSGVVTFALILLATVTIPIQAKLLTEEGQTIGKKALRIRIVRSDTEKNGGFFTNVLIRYFVNGLISFTLVYAVVDILFILTRNRRCVHDYLAETKVVLA